MNIKSYVLKEVELMDSIIKEQMKTTPHYLRGGVYGISTGSGDSLVVAKALELFTKHRIVAEDPYELRLNPPANKGGFIIGISVKGRTREVVKAVEALKGVGWLAVALTSDLLSPLARISDLLVKLNYPGGALPIGIGNFISALTASAALAGIGYFGGLPSPEVSGSLKNVLLGDDILIVGDHAGNLAGEFISLKLSEIFCKPSRIFKVEQFLHAPVYSLKPTSTILLIGSDEKTLKTYEILKDLNNEVAYLRSESRDSFTSVLTYISRLLMELADIADDLGLEEPCFKTRKTLLERTTSIIYG